MNSQLRQDAQYIIDHTISSVLPDKAVIKALEQIKFNDGKLILIAVGKASYSMAKATYDYLDHIDEGVVISKYGHIQGNLGLLKCFEAGHPVVDENSCIATQYALNLVKDLSPNDNVLFLLSGGGSALFEKPKVDLEVLQDITQQLLACGANINEINTIRKHLSYVKGGQFALSCYPAHVYSIVLSDIIGSPLNSIASGPAYLDSTTCQQATDIVNKYNLKVSDDTFEVLKQETPKQLNNVTTYVTGSVSELCIYAKQYCQQLGYETYLLSDCLDCEASQAGRFLGSIALTHANDHKKIAFIAGGETVVHLKGNGKGGRNQEIALSAASLIKEQQHIAIFSLGSDGTDGPTDAAGGYVDGDTYHVLQDKGICIDEVLANNDAYNALRQCNGLIVTGPTGTNVNDVSVILINNE